MSDYLDPNNEELLKDFFMEAELQVDTLEQNILVLENDPSNHDSIDEIFRAAHTLKGAAATVQMAELASFTHVVEDVLDEIRSDVVSVDGSVVDILLESIDIVKGMLTERKNGSIYEADISQTSDRLHNLLLGQKKADAETAPAKSTPKADTQEDAVPSLDRVSSAKSATSDAVATLSEYEILELKEAADEGHTVFVVSVAFEEDHPMNTVGGIQVYAALKNAGDVLRTTPEFEKLYEDEFFPTVHYYVSSDQAEDEVAAHIDIPEVVTGISVQTIDDVFNGSTDSRAGETPEEQEEVAPAKASADNSMKEATERSKPPEEMDSAVESLPAKEQDAPDATTKPAKAAEPKKSGTMGSVLRVDSSRIDNLLNLVSEAVINKATFNQISAQFTETQLRLQTTEGEFREKIKDLFDSLPDYLDNIQRGKSIKDIKRDILDRYGDLFTLLDPFENSLKDTVSKFRSTAQNLGRITSELQEGVMQIRMVPISQIFSRFPRLVRDVSKSLNKKVKLIIEGEDTELDKSVIEDLLDPLIHCVRNSVDHGVESPEEREEAGKATEGTVLLKASNEGNMIIIEISDDGKGIDIDSVRNKAIERGVIHPTKKMSDIEAFNLIFEPGFSTAKKVTNISGRGVGLDVVKKQIEKLNGNVSVWSEKGAGTKLTIKLPLTLAIIQGLLVRVGTEVYAIPITSVIDSHRIKPSEIKRIDNYEVFNVREDVVSLIRLSRLFGIHTKEQTEYHFVVIVGSGDKRMGLMVDSLIGEEDVVIKPLRDRYTNSPGIAGATILGDGTVSLIIDVSQLLELGLQQEIEQRRRREATIR